MINTIIYHTIFWGLVAVIIFGFYILVTMPKQESELEKFCENNGAFYVGGFNAHCEYPLKVYYQDGTSADLRVNINK